MDNNTGGALDGRRLSFCVAEDFLFYLQQDGGLVVVGVNSFQGIAPMMTAIYRSA